MLNPRDPITYDVDGSEAKMVKLIGVDTELAAFYSSEHIISVSAVNVKLNWAC
jgi:hypothetical protein